MFEAGSGHAVATIVGIAIVVTILIGFPNIESQQVKYLEMLYSVDILIITAAVVVTVGFLIIKIPEIASDMLFTARYLKSRGWIHEMRKQERQHAKSVVAKIFSGDLAGILWVCSTFLTVFLVFVDPERFVRILDYLLPVLNEDELVQAVKITEHLVLVSVVSSLAITVLTIFPEIFNDIYGWFVKKHGDKSEFA